MSGSEREMVVCTSVGQGASQAWWTCTVDQVLIHLSSNHLSCQGWESQHLILVGSARTCVKRNAGRLCEPIKAAESINWVWRVLYYAIYKHSWYVSVGLPIIDRGNLSRGRGGGPTRGRSSPECGVKNRSHIWITESWTHANKWFRFSGAYYDRIMSRWIDYWFPNDRLDYHGSSAFRSH